MFLSMTLNPKYEIEAFQYMLFRLKQDSEKANPNRVEKYYKPQITETEKRLNTIIVNDIARRNSHEIVQAVCNYFEVSIVELKKDTRPNKPLKTAVYLFHASGLKNKEIAEILQLSESTISYHLKTMVKTWNAEDDYHLQEIQKQILKNRLIMNNLNGALSIGALIQQIEKVPFEKRTENVKNLHASLIDLKVKVGHNKAVVPETPQILVEIAKCK